MTQQLSAQDAQFLYIQNGNTLTHVMGINLYDPSTAPGGQVRFKDIIAHFESRIDMSPVFKRKLYRLPLDLDHPYWIEDPDFELEAHLYHARLPEPGDWRQFCIQVARHFSRPMDMDRPLWDAFVLEGLDRIPGVAPGSYAIMTRIHHAAIDGASAAHMFVALSDIDAAGTPVLQQVPPATLGQQPNPLQVMARMVSANLTSPVRFMSSLARLSPALLSAAQTRLAQPAAERSGVPKTLFNAPISPHRMFDATDFALADLSAIRKLVPGATINDVVLAICAGALRAYLLRHKALPDQPLVAVAPINLRPATGDASVPGNNISAMSVELPTNQADPATRLRLVREYTAAAKEAKAGISARVMTDLTQHIPGATMAGVARILTQPGFAPRQANVYISNVPGPQVPLYMNGAISTRQYAMAPLANNMGLFIATPSYAGRMTFCITTDREIMRDVDVLRHCIEAAFAELLAAAKAAPAPAAEQPKPKKAARAPKPSKAGATTPRHPIARPKSK